MNRRALVIGALVSLMVASLATPPLLRFWDLHLCFDAPGAFASDQLRCRGSSEYVPLLQRGFTTLAWVLLLLPAWAASLGAFVVTARLAARLTRPRP